MSRGERVALSAVAAVLSAIIVVAIGSLTGRPTTAPMLMVAAASAVLVFNLLTIRR